MRLLQAFAVFCAFFASTGRAQTVLVVSSDTTLAAGSTATLACVSYVSGGNEVISWSYNGQALMNSPLVTIYEEEVSPNGSQVVFMLSLLQLCNIGSSAAGSYICTTRDGSSTATSAVELTVTGEDFAQVVRLTRDSMPMRLETIVLACAGIGRPNVQTSWYRNGEALMNSSLITIYGERVGANSMISFLELCGLNGFDSGDYTCMVDNGVAAINTATTRLNVTGPAIAQVIAISSDTSLNVGGTALLSCVGFSGPDEVRVGWSFKGEPVQNTSLITYYRETTQGFIYHSFLQLCNVGSSETGTYTCTITNGLATATATTRVTVIGFDAVDLALISNSTSLEIGQTAVLACMGFGHPNLYISWLLNGEAVEFSSLTSMSRVGVTMGGSTFISYLELCDATPSMAGGEYTCVVTNGKTVATSTTRLNIAAETPRLNLISADTSLLAGETAILACVGSARFITWNFNGQAIQNSSLSTIYEERTVENGREYTQSLLQLCGVSSSYSGEYTCSARNDLVTVNATTRLTISDDFVRLGAISNDTSVALGQTAVLACAGFGFPLVDISWSFNGRILTDTSLLTIVDEEIDEMGFFKQSFLQLCDLIQSESGAYTCIVGNGFQTTNATTRLMVSALPEGDIASILVISGNTSLSVRDTALFTCVGYGYPSVAVSWTFNSQPVENTTLVNTYEVAAYRPGVMQSFLQVCNIDRTNIGDYTCFVSNGQETRNVTTQLTFSGEGPVSAVTLVSDATSVDSGETVILACIGFGLPYINIDWSYGDEIVTDSSLVSLYREEIENNNRTYQLLLLELCGLERSSAGEYTCIVDNGQRLVSATTLLTVSGVNGDEIVFLPLISINHTTLGGGETALLGCMGFGTPDVTITWSFNGMTLTNSSQAATIYEEGITYEKWSYTISYLQLCNVRESNAGAYTCTVSNGLVEASSDVMLLSVMTGRCPRNVQTLMVDGQVRGQLEWEDSAIGETLILDCPCPQAQVPGQATRVCAGEIGLAGQWMEANVMDCQFSSLAWELCNSQNVGSVGTLTSDPSPINSLDISIATGFIENRIDTAMGDASESDALFGVIDNLLKVPLDDLKGSQEEFNSSGRLLSLIEQLTESYPIQQIPTLIIGDTFGCALYPALDGGALSFSPDLQDDIELISAATPTVSMLLPSSLPSAIGDSRPALAYCGFKGEGLFIRRNSSDQDQRSFELASNVVFARLSGGVVVENLDEPVQMVFAKTRDGNGKTNCSFWDRRLDGGYGGWSSEGCQLVSNSAEEATCQCNRLSTFGILVEIAGPEINIERFMIIGAVFLLVCVVLVLLLTFIARYRSKKPTAAVEVFLINLCSAFFCLYISFIVSSFVNESQTPCTVFSFLFHCFFLISCASLTLLALFTAVSASFSGKKGKLAYVCLILADWVFPCIVVAICIGAKESSYSSDSRDFCGPEAEPYWYGLLLIGGLFLLLTAFLLVLIPILRRGSNTTDKRGFNSRWYSDYIALSIVAVCFYVAWGFGLPALQPLNLGVTRLIFQIIFIAINIVLGLLMIVSFCFLSEEVGLLFRKPVYTMKYEGDEMSQGMGMTLSEKNEELHFRASTMGASLLPPDYDTLRAEDAESVTLETGLEAPEFGEEMKADLQDILEANTDMPF